MIDNRLVKIQEEIERLKADNSKKLSEANKMIDQYDSKISELNTNINKALQGANAELYSKLSQEKRTLEDMRQMYLIKQQEYTSERLMDKDSFISTCNQIKDILEEKNNQSIKKIKAIYSQIVSLHEEEEQNVDFGNELMNDLQANVYKDEDKITAGNSKTFIGYQRKQEYKHRPMQGLDYNVKHWFDNAIKGVN